MPRPTTAILLVAGMGRRLGTELPKCLAPLGDGTTLLQRAADALAQAGVEHLVLATGYRQNAIVEAARKLPLSFELRRNPDYHRTQNAVSLWYCRDAVEGEGFYKLNGDVLFRPEVIERLASCHASVAVALDRAASLGDEEMKAITQGDRVLAFGKAIAPHRAAGETLGIERFDADAGARLFDALGAAIAAGRTDVYYEDVYGDLIADGVRFEAVDVSDLPWTEVDTPEDLAQARALALDTRLPARHLLDTLPMAQAATA